ncbi:unnamed protein product, partial [Prorocentrum cordatum]
GFFHMMFYKNFSLAAQAAAEAGVTLPRAVQVDRCVWNHQHMQDCPGKLKCSDIVMIHKDLWSTCKKRSSSAVSSLYAGGRRLEERRLEEHRCAHAWADG